MIVSERMQPIGTNRVVFRQLSPVLSYPARNRVRYAVCQPVKWYRLDLSPTWLNRTVRIPHWVIALSLVATLTVSAAFSVALASQQTVPVPIVNVIPISAPSSSIPAGKTLSALGESPVSVGESNSYAQIATLQGQVQSMNSNLQSLQQQNDALRNASHAQNNDLTSARTDLAGSQESLQGQSQEMNARVGTMQQDLQSRLGSLDKSISSADQVVSDVRTLLGLPPSSSQSAVGGQ
jgi:hypothetical protein